MSKSEWFDTPGLNYLLTQKVPEAAEILKSDEHYDPILLAGPTGTGKSYIRDRILEAAGFKKRDEEADPKMVVKVNCAAVPENLIDSILFGYMKGAFTGATTDKKGLVGSGAEVLVLDEIGTVPKHIQAKLLTFLDTGEYMRIGATKNEKSKTKILAITNAELDGEEVDTTFRRDFFFRFHPIYVPGLHARRSDIPFLLADLSPGVPWTKGDLLLLMAYNWPGNVRQLRKITDWVRRHIETPIKYPLQVNGVFYKLESHGLEPPFGEPRCRPVFNLVSLLYKDRALGDDIGSLVGRFPLGKKTVGEITELSEPTEAEHRIDLNPWFERMGGGTVPVMKRPLLGKKWDTNWLFWCNLFRQDPKHKGDIIKCILEREITGDKQLRHSPPIPVRHNVTELMWEEGDRISELMEQLCTRIDKILWPTLTKPQSAPPQSGTNNKGPNGLEPATRFSPAFKEVADVMTPNEYRELWFNYFSGLSPKGISDKFNGRISDNVIKKKRQRDRKKKLENE